jgi:AcrR family transcriptional regulator
MLLEAWEAEKQVVSRQSKNIFGFTEHCSLVLRKHSSVMGIGDRKQRHKDDLKDTILKAAKELFLEKGFEHTSMRNLAEKIEYSPATIYLHFKDKNEVFYALHQEGFRMLVSSFKTLNNVANPFERLKAMGYAYVNFATENPDFYQLMFVMSEPLSVLKMDIAKCWDEGEDAFRFLLNTVIECQDQGYFKGLEPNGLSFAVWSTVHGLASLRTSGHLDHVLQAKTQMADINVVTNHTMDTYIAMLERIK